MSAFTAKSKQVLEAALLFLANCPLPLTSQQNCSHGLQLIMHVVVILASNLVFLLSAEGLGEKKVLSFSEPSLIERDGKGCNRKLNQIHQQTLMQHCKDTVFSILIAEV